MNKIIIVAITLVILLSGCRTDDEYDTVVKEKATLAKELAQATKKINIFETGETALANRIARHKLEIADDEIRLEIALTCTYLPINICPPVMGELNFEAYQKAGIQPSYTWRSWLIYIFGIGVWILAIWLTSLGLAQAYRISQEPRNSDVIAGRATIAEAEKQRILVLGNFLDEKMQLQLQLGEIKLLIQKATAQLSEIDSEIQGCRHRLDCLDIDIEDRQLELDELVEELSKKRKLFGESVARIS